MERPVGRRAALAAVGGGLLGLAGCLGGGRDGGTDGGTATGTSEGPSGGTGADGETTAGADGPRVGLETLATGFAAPVTYEPVPGAPGEGVVVDQPGRAYRLAGGERLGTYLDLRDRTVSVRSGYDERGFLGLAFHPDFAANGRLFARYSAPPRAGTPEGYDHTFVLSEFRAEGSEVDPGTERVLLEVPQPQMNHNAGDLAFGPDGLLYVGVGDGGGANDTGRGHVEDWYGGNAGGNGQDVVENLLGSVLRIDVDGGAGASDGEGGGRPYGVPEDNPLVGREGLDEQYAWGLRNPWRLSFDGDRLIAADVGQNRYEEVNVVERGGNYGWNVREGRTCFAASSPSNPPTDCPTVTADGERLRDPVVSYPHGDEGVAGVAVIGGVVDADGATPATEGRYVFADWNANGRLFLADPTGERWPTSVLPVEDPGPDVGQYVLGFGRGDGDVYVLTTGRAGPGGSTGALHRLTPA
jgi:glucose/arabinose dehydrogenase